MTEACGSNLAGVPRWARYPAYKDSEVEWLGEIPSHWEVGRLKKTVSECQNGVWGEDPDGTNDVACIRVADFDRDNFSVDSSSLTLRRVDSRALSTHRLRRGDLLLEKSGGGERQPVGAVVIFADDLPAVCSNFIARMPASDGHTPVFLVYLHAALYSSRINVRSIKQSIGIQNLDSDSYLNELVGLPPLDEQHEIGSFLDRETAKTDALVAKQRELIGLLQEKRTALISHAVTKGLDSNASMKDSGVEWLGEIPAHWEVAALQYRYEQSLGKMLDAKRITGDHLVPYLRNADVQWDHINLSDLPRMDIRPHELDRFTVRPGDLLVCEGGEAGRCAIWDGDLDPCGYQKALHRLRPLDSVRDAPRFLYYTLSAAVARRAFAGGQGSTIGHLTGDMLRAQRFPFPPTTEQRAIVRNLDRETAKIDALIAKADDAIAHLNEYRTALISTAVTGKIDVRAFQTDTAPNPPTPPPTP